MLRKRRAVLVLWECFIICFFAQCDFTFAGGLDRYLDGQPLMVGSIKRVPVTIRDGMESQKTPSWPLKNPSKIFESPAYVKNEQRALKVGIDLKEKMDVYSIVGYKNGAFFFLFYHFLTAVGCPNDYIIQKVKLSKSFYDLSGNPYKQRQEYLVEALELNFKKETKRADEQRKEYTLGKFHRRKIVMDLEIGCGEIPKVIKGKAWPYPENKLYYRIQDYSDTPGLYDKVHFDFSSTYRITMEFDRDGKYSLDLPPSE